MERSLHIFFVLALACACGDDGGRSSDTGVTTATPSTTAPTGTTPLTTAGSDTDMSGTTGETTGSSSGEATTGDPSTDPSDPSDATTGDPSGPETGGDLIPGCTHLWTFETCPDGWAVEVVDPNAPGAPSWECGEAGGNVANAEAHPGVWATSLAGDYNEEESSALVSPSFSLADCPGATVYLSLAHLYAFGSGDGGTVQLSAGGGPWATVIPTWHGYCPGTLDTDFSPPGGEPGFCDGDDELWTHTLIPLDHGGEPDVRVRLVFGSNGIIEDPGWYVDAVSVEAYQ